MRIDLHYSHSFLFNYSEDVELSEIESITSEENCIEEEQEKKSKVKVQEQTTFSEHQENWGHFVQDQYSQPHQGREHFMAPGSIPAPPFAMPIPSLISDDDGMSDLLMAWYYAGYFSGRYSAKQEMLQKRNQ